MLTIRNISIRNKLILMQVFTSVLVLSIVFTVFVVTEIRGYKQRKLDSMISLAQVIATNTTSTLQFQSPDDANKILEELHNVTPEISHAAILNDQNKFFAGYARGGKDSSFIREALNTVNAAFVDDVLFINKPVIIDNKTIGKVLFQVELTELEKIKQGIYNQALILLLIALAFSFLLAFLTHPYISKRLLNLVKTMKEVNKTGNYDTSISDDGKDEIGTLIKVYNNLMLQVKENQHRKDEFIGIASHELKTPLTSVKGYLDLLNAMEAEDKKKQIVRKAQDNVSKLEKLIRDLLDVSKIQSGQLELVVQEFNIDDLLNETIASLQIISSSHTIIKDTPDTSVMIHADRQRIEQVLLNLLSNAIKYSPGEKKIVVSCNKEENYLVIKIRDFGTGIAEEEQENIFERFYRAKDTSALISGFGLGLYICRDIIQRHHGKIWVKKAEKGSVFMVSLPL